MDMRKNTGGGRRYSLDLNIFYQRRWTTERQRRPRHVMSTVMAAEVCGGPTAVEVVIGAYRRCRRRRRRPPKSGPRDDCGPVPRPAAASSVLFVPGQQNSGNSRRAPCASLFCVFLNAAARNKKHVTVQHHRHDEITILSLYLHARAIRIIIKIECRVPSSWSILANNRSHRYHCYYCTKSHDNRPPLPPPPNSRCTQHVGKIIDDRKYYYVSNVFFFLFSSLIKYAHEYNIYTHTLRTYIICEKHIIKYNKQW